MAFNFNWSPLTADATFYSRARDLLTTALNKTPKPPIIVDDILVDELNLGSVPPELEILEIGDLAEDRFRGIFKMCYRGDAFLTLKTRVQANPLNTYLDSKPTFTSPQPLAAASGLTIPLSITLSEIKLSAFIILVFSKQKGLTLVFRNDPLESLKVSSTFDSIQFVRDYLQRTIEGQLRSLMMDELPAIIHRLSLQFWCPDQVAKAEGAAAAAADGDVGQSDEPGTDPFASPPIDPVDANGNLLDATDVAELSLNGGGEVQSLFSQKNLLQMSSLNETNKTFSIVTPSVREAVFRAWMSTGGGADVQNNNNNNNNNPGPTATPSLNRSPGPSSLDSTAYCPSDAGSIAHGHLPSRPSLVSLQSATTGLSLGSGSRSRSYTGRKKKTRVVNLRRTKTESGGESSTATAEETQSDVGATFSHDSDIASMRAPVSELIMSGSIPEEPGQEAEEDKHEEEEGSSSSVPRPEGLDDLDGTFFDAVESSSSSMQDYFSSVGSSEKQTTSSTKKGDKGAETTTRNRHQHALSDASTIQEHAWIMKMADEIARRVYDEQRRQQEEDVGPPPAYEATTPR